MGQYFKPAIIAANDNEATTVLAWLYSHDYDKGLKLMEHSWIQNDFVMNVEALFIPGGKFHGHKLVWAGDYAEHEEGITKNIYELCLPANKIMPQVTMADMKGFDFVVNHDLKLFVDKTKVPKDKDNWQMHPLPLLTAEGNGEGGGDFDGNDNNNIIGSWARCSISIAKSAPEGYTELIFDLVE